MIPRVETFFGCFKLETGGIIIGFVNLLYALLGTLIFFIYGLLFINERKFLSDFSLLLISNTCKNNFF